VFRCSDRTQCTFCVATSGRLPTIGQALRNLIRDELPASLEVVTNLGEQVAQGFFGYAGTYIGPLIAERIKPSPGRELGRESNNI
jgi:hypothetical protein